MAAARNESVRVDLTLKLIKQLTLNEVPVRINSDGKLLFQPNLKVLPSGGANPSYKASYILWDSSPHAPPGFGVKVSTKKTYVLRRKVNGVSRMPTVGNFADFNKIEDARARAADLARVVVETGLNPNELARKEAKSEYTLREAFQRYRKHLVLSLALFPRGEVT